MHSPYSTPAASGCRSALRTATSGPPRWPRPDSPTWSPCHAIVGPPADGSHVGTDVVLTGVTTEQIEAAKSFFLRFRRHGAGGDPVWPGAGPPARSKTARVYVEGLLVAHEENFLFSYNITDINAPLRKALNRERSTSAAAPTPTGSRRSSSSAPARP